MITPVAVQQHLPNTFGSGLQSHPFVCRTNPVGHRHLKEPTRFVQVPKQRSGNKLHSFTSVEEREEK